MSGEPEIIAPEPEAEMPPIEPEEPEKVEDDLEPELEVEAKGEEEEALDQDEEPEEELEEFDWNGQKIKGPKGLKDGVMMRADYSRKTEEVANRRRELDQREQTLKEQSEAHEEDLNMRATFVAKYQQAEQYRKADWNAWVQSDPIAAQQAKIQWDNLERDLSGLGHQIQQRMTQRSEESQQATAKRLQETLEFARKDIKGWTPDLDQKIGDFARAQGVDDGELQAVLSPTVYKMLHLAYLGSQALSKPAAPKPAPKPAQPLQTVRAKGSTPAHKSLQDMEMEEYAAYRQKGGRG